MSVKVSSRVYGTPSRQLEIPGEPFHGRWTILRSTWTTVRITGMNQFVWWHVHQRQSWQDCV